MQCMCSLSLQVAWTAAALLQSLFIPAHTVHANLQSITTASHATDFTQQH